MRQHGNHSIHFVPTRSLKHQSQPTSTCKSISNSSNQSSSDPIANQLSSIASHLDTIDALAAELAALKAQASNVPQADTSVGVSDKGKTNELILVPEIEENFMVWRRRRHR